MHPECSANVVELADRSGSTSQIIAFVEAASAGTTIAVGTEARLVHRLQRLHSDKRIVNLADVPPYCRTMTETTPIDLLETLQEIESGDIEPRTVRVGEETAHGARLALTRMLEL